MAITTRMSLSQSSSLALTLSSATAECCLSHARPPRTGYPPTVRSCSSGLSSTKPRRFHVGKTLLMSCTSQATSRPIPPAPTMTSGESGILAKDEVHYALDVSLAWHDVLKGSPVINEKGWHGKTMNSLAIFLPLFLPSLCIIFTLISNPRHIHKVLCVSNKDRRIHRLAVFTRLASNSVQQPTL